MLDQLQLNCSESTIIQGTGHLCVQPTTNFQDWHLRRKRKLFKSFSCSYLLHGLLGRICTECNCYKTVVAFPLLKTRTSRLDWSRRERCQDQLARLVGVRVYCTKPAEDVYNIHVLQRIWRRCIIYIFGFH